MATITGLTAARMLAIEDEVVVDGEIVGGNLILTRHDGTTIDAGPVIGPAGPTGPEGPAGGLIPGEVRLWPGNTLPELGSYGLWDWADGGVLAVADYPIAAGHIDTHWRTFGGASDPGGANFRKPDLRGLVPAGLDQMPGGTRANRMLRAVAIIIAGKSGEETHVITLPESPAHAHGVTDPGHYHALDYSNGGGGPTVYPYPVMSQPRTTSDFVATTQSEVASTGISINNAGGGGAHENVQPTVFVPYIVKLDD